MTFVVAGKILPKWRFCWDPNSLLWNLEWGPPPSGCIVSNIKRKHLERNTCFNKTFFQVPDPDAVAGPLEVQLCDRMVDRLGAELEKENGKTKIFLFLWRFWSQHFHFFPLWNQRLFLQLWKADLLINITRMRGLVSLMSVLIRVLTISWQTPASDEGSRSWLQTSSLVSASGVEAAGPHRVLS